MKFIEQFKAFLLRGNVIDLAVGMVVGTAFTNMVKSLVDNVIMPPIGLLIGGVDFSNLFITLRSGSKYPGPYETLGAAQAAGAVTLNIGLFINTVISLVIIGFAIFWLSKESTNCIKALPRKLLQNSARNAVQIFRFRQNAARIAHLS